MKPMTSKLLATMLFTLVTLATCCESSQAFYHPKMGRFVNRDPGGQPGFQAGAARSGIATPSAAATPAFVPRDAPGYVDGYNLYQYVGDNPVGNVDPSGLKILPFPIPVGPPVTRPNQKTLLGFNSCFFAPTTKAGRTKICRKKMIPRGITIPLGPASGNHSFYGAGQHGAGGCGTCICLVVRCPPSGGNNGGVAVFHFTAGDDPAATLQQYSFPAGCKAIACGGDNSRPSNCLADKVLGAIKVTPVDLQGVSKASACGIFPNGFWYTAY